MKVQSKFKVQRANHLDLIGTEWENKKRYVVVGLLEGHKDYVIITCEHLSFKDAKEEARALLYEDELCQTVEFHRPPTAYEVKFGEGAIHYKDFSPLDYVKKDGTIKFRLKCPIDGLIYTRSKH